MPGSQKLECSASSAAASGGGNHTYHDNHQKLPESLGMSKPAILYLSWWGSRTWAREVNNKAERKASRRDMSCPCILKSRDKGGEVEYNQLKIIYLILLEKKEKCLQWYCAVGGGYLLFALPTLQAEGSLPAQRPLANLIFRGFTHSGNYGMCLFPAHTGGGNSDV